MENLERNCGTALSLREESHADEIAQIFVNECYARAYHNGADLSEDAVTRAANEAARDCIRDARNSGTFGIGRQANWWTANGRICRRVIEFLTH